MARGRPQTATFYKATIILWALMLQPTLLLGQSMKQRAQRDSLDRLLPAAKGPQRVDLLNKIGWQYRKFQPDSTLFYSKKALELAEKIDYHHGASEALSFIGIAYRYQSESKEALSYFLLAKSMAEEHRDTIEIAYSYNNIGSIHQSLGDYPEAYRNYQKALRLFNQINWKEGLAYVYENMSRSYSAEGNLRLAINSAEKALDIREKNGSTSNLISSLLETGGLYIQANQLPTAKKRLEKAKKLSDEQGSVVFKAMCNLSLASFYEHLKAYEKALFYAKTAERQYQEVVNPYEQNRSLIILGRIHLHLNDNNEADYFLSKALRQARQNQHYSLEIDCYGLLAQLQESRENYKRALGYHKRYLAGRDSLSAKRQMQEMQKLEQSVSMMQKERELERLKQKEEENREKVEKEQQKSLWLSILLIILGLFLFVLIRYVQQQRKANRLLNEQKRKITAQNMSIQQKHQHLQEANQKLEEINEEKDNLMGVVAHDLKSPLNKVKGYVQILQMLGNLEGEEKQIVDDIDRVVEGGRRLIQDLLDIHTEEYHSKSIETSTISMKELLQDIIHGFETPSRQKQLDISCSTPDEDVIIISERSSLERVFENLISNAIKFSEPGKKIYLSLHENNGWAQVMIQDEGPGFSESDKQKAFRRFQKLSAKPTAGESSTGLGLAIVKLLMDKLQGKIQLYSEVGQGSEFILEFPKSIKV